MGDLETSIKLTLDTGKSLSNLNQFASAFRRQMLDIGKTKLEIDWIEHLAEEVRAGETALESLSEEMRGFVAEFNSGRQVAADRDALGLKEHAEVERQIEETRASMKAANEVIDAGLYDAGVGDEAAKSLEQPFAAAEKLKEQMDAASEAARGLGISLAEFGPVVTPEFEKVTGQVDTLIGSIDHLKQSGVDVQSVLSAAFSKAIVSARGTAELEELQKRIQALAAAGDLFPSRVRELTGQIAGRMAEIAGGAIKAREAAKALGGKFWNQALFSPGGTLYGKNVARGGMPAHCLYGAPDGTVWACSLNIVNTNGSIKRSWLPRAGDPGNLELTMWRVAGPIERRSGSTLVIVPLSGAQSLIELFPDIVADAQEVSSTLYAALLDTGTAARHYDSQFRFLDALPDGSRALYGVVLSATTRQWEHIYAFCIASTLELTLSGVPNTSGMVATVSAHAGLTSLTSSERFDSSNASAATAELSRPSIGGVAIREPEGYLTEGYAHNGEPTTTLIDGYCNMSATVMAGYVGDVVEYQRLYFTSNYDSDASAVSSTECNGEGFIALDEVDTKTVDLSFSHSASLRAAVHAHMELTLKGVTLMQADMDAVMTQESSLAGTVQCAVNSYGVSLGVKSGGYSGAWSRTVTHTGTLQTTEGSIPLDAVFTEGGADNGDGFPYWHHGNEVYSPENWVGMGMGYEGYIAQVQGGGTLNPAFTIVVGFTSAWNPQAVDVIYGRTAADGSVMVQQGAGISLGAAIAEGSPQFSADPPTRRLSWCPIRDQLLDTNTGSSWV